MSTKTSNFEYTKPGEDEFYDVTEYNQTLDKIDADMQKIKKVEETHTADKVVHVTADDKKKWNTSINDEAPTYTESSTLQDLASGEKLSVAFGKIKKAVSVVKNHINLKASTSAQGHVKLSDSSAVTDSTGLALPATEKNASIEGTLANKIANLGKSVDLVWLIDEKMFDTSNKEAIQSYEVSDKYDSFIILSTNGTVTSILNYVGSESSILTLINESYLQNDIYLAKRQVSVAIAVNSKRCIQFHPCYWRTLAGGGQFNLINSCNVPFRIYGIRK